MLELCPLTAQCPGIAWKCANWGHAPSTWASINTQWPAEVRGSCMTIYKTGATKTQGSGSWDLNICKRWVSTISSQHFLQLCHTLSILPLFCSSPNTSGRAFITSCWPLLCLSVLSPWSLHLCFQSKFPNTQLWLCPTLNEVTMHPLCDLCPRLLVTPY